MTKWGSPNDVLKQLPPILFGTWGGLGILPPLQPPTITSPLVNAGRVPPAGITEGATLPTKNTLHGGVMDRISEDFCLVYFWGNPASLMPEKEHSKDHSLPAGRYVWRFTQPYIYISYISPLGIITMHLPFKSDE